MNNRLLNSYIRDDEHIEEVIQSSWFRHRYRLLRHTCVLLAACFLLYPLQTFGAIGYGIFAFCVLWAIAGFARIAFIHRRTAVILTDKRLIDIDRSSLAQQQVSDCALSTIHDVRYNMKGILATLLSIGTVTIDCGGGHMQIIAVHKPQRIQDTIRDAQAQHSNKHHDKQEEFL